MSDHYYNQMEESVHSATVTVGGTQLQLLPQRAAFWQTHRILIVADIHFGKAAAFRAQGVPVPHGTTSDNLRRLTALVDAYQAAEILFLGDFLHARAAHAPATLAALRQWRAKQQSLQLTLVRGNHDLHAGDPPADLGITIVNEPWDIAGISFCHHPQAAAAGYVLAGHLHPVFRLSAGSDTLRLPCFVVGTHGMVLPSFGAFTGGCIITPGKDKRIYVVADDAVLRLPS